MLTEWKVWVEFSSDWRSKRLACCLVSQRRGPLPKKGMGQTDLGGSWRAGMSRPLRSKLPDRTDAERRFLGRTQFLVLILVYFLCLTSASC